MTPPDHAAAREAPAPPRAEVAELVQVVSPTCETLLFTRSLHVTLRMLCRATVRIVPCDRSSIFLLDGASFRGSANVDTDPERDEHFLHAEIAGDAAIVQALDRRREPVTIADAKNSPLIPPSPAIAADVATLVLAPICDRRGSVVGLLSSEHREITEILPLQSQLVGVMANLAAIGVTLDQAEPPSVDLRNTATDTSAKPPSPSPSLSEREYQVLELITRGYTNEEAADRLHLSVRTVESHRAGLMSKLGATTRAELVRAAEAEGLVLFRARSG